MKFNCTINKIQIVGTFVFVYYTMTDPTGKATGDSLNVFNQEDFKAMPFTVGTSFTRTDSYQGKTLTTTWQP